MGVPILMHDLVSTLYRFHHDGSHTRAWPVACYVNPRTLDELRWTSPEYFVEERDSKVYICGVEMRTDSDLGPDMVTFSVPAFLMKKMLGVSAPPVLYNKPEYSHHSNDQRGVLPWKRP